MILMCFKVLFTGSVISDSLHAHGLQHTSFPVLHHLLELAQTPVHWVGDAIQPSWCLPLLLLPSVFPSIKVFSNELALCLRWPKYWSFSISPYSGYPGLIPFTIDQFDLLEVQGTLKSLIRHLYWLAFIWGSGRAGHGNGLLLSWLEKRLACA